MASLSQTSDATSLYKIWKIERQIWLEGLRAMQEHVLPDAIIIPPHPMPTQRLEDLIKGAKRAAPFETVEFKEKQFLNLGDSIIITYRAVGKHQRYRQKYTARCLTTYIRLDGKMKIAGHSHFRLPKS